jgi:hypothetical protein
MDVAELKELQLRLTEVIAAATGPSPDRPPG